MRQNKETRIIAHMYKLVEIFPAIRGEAVYGSRGDHAYRKLRRLEAEGQTLALRNCNGDISDAAAEKKEASILRRLNDILRFKEEGVPVFLNGDPRGYALKIDDQYVRDHNLNIERDWGGYGVICPKF